MANEALLIDYPGTYGGPSSRDEVMRVLKEALALVEATPRGTVLNCSGLRIECSDPGAARAARTAARK